MMLPLVFVLVAGASFWLGVKQIRDYKNSEGDFSDWVVTDADRVNRRLWRVRAWMDMVILPLVGVGCLYGAFETAFGR